MKNFFGRVFFLLVAVIFSLSTDVSALPRLANSDAILADMYANPGKYIRYGGASIGLSFLVDKTSIDVHVYNPPEYIISIREITHYNGVSKENIEYETVYRYRYDYDSRKMYKEDKDDNGVVSWKLIDPAASKSYHDDNWVALGEIMFYLAYNMSFYDSPIVAKQFINEGRSGLPLINLPNGGDSTVWHYYNHKTKQIEWWKHTYDKRTKENDFVRIK